MRSAFIKCSVVAVLLLLASHLPTLGQVPSGYTCVAKLNVIADDNCSYLLDPYTVLKGEPKLDGLKVFVYDNDISNRGLVDCPGIFSYNVTTANNAIICWGFIEMQDNQGPIPVDSIFLKDTLECAQIDQILNNPNTIEPTIDGQVNKYYLGEVTFRENCNSCNCEMNRKFFDQVDFFACDSLPYFAKITRQWTATDCLGQSTVVNQYFHLVRPSFDSLTLVEDLVISTCQTDTVNVHINYPYWIDSFEDTLFVNDLDCNLDINISTENIETCDATGFTQQNIVRVFDWCTGESTNIDTFLVKVGDFEQPELKGNLIPTNPNSILNRLNTEVDRDSILRLLERGLISQHSTGPMDCTLGFSANLDDLKAYFNFEIEDCGISQHSLRFFTYEAESVGGLPSGDTSWQIADFNVSLPLESGLVTGLANGLHAMLLTARDACGNANDGLVFFQVNDNIPPLAKCVDELNITMGVSGGLNSTAYARVFAADLDEGSWDNCNLSALLVRRAVPNLESRIQTFVNAGYDSNADQLIDEQDYYDSNQNGQKDEEEFFWELVDSVWYSPWQPFVEFFCEDVDKSVIVELRAADESSNPITGERIQNTSICWMMLDLEENSTPEVQALANQQIDCSHPILSQIKFGLLDNIADSLLIQSLNEAFGAPILFSDACGQSIVEQRLTNEQDNCGFGKIVRTIIATKTNSKQTVIDTTNQEIEITESYKYWIKFPKDIEANCSEGVVDSGSIELFQENCDLLAVAHSDEYFYAPQAPGACFKIFRTFSVINWCEYNGSSAPVVVSRDWDTWNGVVCDSNYLVNPLRPDGNNAPGDQDLYVIVHRNFNDNIPDTVYYDADANPYNTFPDDTLTKNIEEGYWWKVISGPGRPEQSSYFADPIVCDSLVPATAGNLLPNVWGADLNENLNNPNQDDKDVRYGSYGYWQYTQHISVVDDIFPVLQVEGPDAICLDDPINCSGRLELQLSVDDQCVGSSNLEIEVFFDQDANGENEIDYTDSVRNNVFQASFPLGNHRLILKANDNCGNVATRTFSFLVRDCKGPAPICRDAIVVELSPGIHPDDSTNYSSFVWASDFIQSPIFDCTGQGPEQDEFGKSTVRTFSINRAGEPVTVEDQALEVGCSDLGNPIMVEVHAWDEAGNNDFCAVFLQVQDNGQGCPQSGTGALSGALFTEDQRPVNNVEVDLSGTIPDFTSSQSNGNYHFEQVSIGQDYTIRPSLDQDHLNGISTFDILIIQKHILGIERLESPYQMIAADANRSGAITTLDLIALRKLILKVDLVFEENTSWRFVPLAYQFPNSFNPWQEQFPEFININNLQDSISDNHFVAIKVGDVSGNVITSRHQDALEIHYEDIDLKAGQYYEIPLLGNLSHIEGLQLTLGTRQAWVSLEKIRPGIIDASFYHQKNHQIHLSWNEASGFHHSAETVLFYLAFRAERAAKLSEVLYLDQKGISAEAYTASKTIQEVQLVPSSSTNKAGAIGQNFPNPFTTHTTIPLQLSQAGLVKFQVMNVEGKVLHAWQKNFESGEHQIQISPSDLAGRGIYLYKINVGDIEQTKRMIYF